MSTDSRGSAAGAIAIIPNESAAKALDLMAEALALLDAHGVPADAGAHLDLALHRLREWAGEATVI